MKPDRALLLAFALTSTSAINSVAQADDPSQGFVHLAPDDLEFQAVEGIKGASQITLMGNPSEAGTYVMRYRIPAGQLVPPHHRSGSSHHSDLRDMGLRHGHFQILR